MTRNFLITLLVSFVLCCNNTDDLASKNTSSHNESFSESKTKPSSTVSKTPNTPSTTSTQSITKIPVTTRPPKTPIKLETMQGPFVSPDKICAFLEKTWKQANKKKMHEEEINPGDSDTFFCYNGHWWAEGSFRKETRLEEEKELQEAGNAEARQKERSLIEFSPPSPFVRAIIIKAGYDRGGGECSVTDFYLSLQSESSWYLQKFANLNASACSAATYVEKPPSLRVETLAQKGPQVPVAQVSLSDYCPESEEEEDCEQLIQDSMIICGFDPKTPYCTETILISEALVKETPESWNLNVSFLVNAIELKSASKNLPETQKNLLGVHIVHPR